MRLSNLPPGCSLSAPGGPEDPARIRWEEAMGKLGTAFEEATLAGVTVAEAYEVWAEAAEDAFYKEEEQYRKEEAMYAVLDSYEEERL